MNGITPVRSAKNVSEETRKSYGNQSQECFLTATNEKKEEVDLSALVLSEQEIKAEKSIIFLQTLESLELRYHKQKCDTDHAKLMAIRHAYKVYPAMFTYLKQFNTYTSFKTQYLNLLWSIINAGASIHKPYFELLKISYLAESQLDISDRKFTLLNRLYPDMSIIEAADVFLSRLLPVGKVSATRNAVSETHHGVQNNTATTTQNATATQPTKENVPPSLPQSGFDQNMKQDKNENTENAYLSKLVSHLNKPKILHVKFLQNVRSLIGFERIEMSFYQQKVNTDHARLMVMIQKFKDQNYTYPQRFDTFKRFKADYLDFMWTNLIAEVDEVDKIYFESYKKSYMVDSQFHFMVRKYLLLKLFFKNNFTINTATHFHIQLPADLASVIKKAVAEIDVAQSGVKPSQNATATMLANNVTVPPTPQDSFTDVTMVQDQSENKVNTVSPSELVSKSSKQKMPLSDTKKSILCLLVIEKIEFLCYQQKVHTDDAKLKILKQIFKETGISIENYFDSLSSFKEHFINKHWTRINAGAGIHKIYFESFKMSYIVESQLNFDCREFLLLEHLFPNMSIPEAAVNWMSRSLSIWHLP